MASLVYSSVVLSMLKELDEFKRASACQSEFGMISAEVEFSKSMLPKELKIDE